MYQCPQCDKSFENQRQLAGHIRSHTKSHLPECCCIITRKQMLVSKLSRYQAQLKHCVVCDTLFHFVPSAKATCTCSASCARTVGNLTRGARSEEAKLAISNGLRKSKAKQTLIKTRARQVPYTSKHHHVISGPYTPLYRCTCAHCGVVQVQRSRTKYCQQHSNLYKQDNRNRYAFTFNVYDYPELFDLTTLNKVGWYSPGGKAGKWNPDGLSRDHKVSVNYAIKHNCDPYYIRHPLNCELIPQTLNNSKKSSNSISYEELISLVDEYEQRH